MGTGRYESSLHHRHAIQGGLLVQVDPSAPELGRRRRKERGEGKGKGEGRGEGEGRGDRRGRTRVCSYILYAHVSGMNVGRRKGACG